MTSVENQNEKWHAYLKWPLVMMLLAEMWCESRAIFYQTKEEKHNSVSRQMQITIPTKTTTFNECFNQYLLDDFIADKTL